MMIKMIYRSKKMIFSIIILISLLILSGCEKEKVDLSKIPQDTGTTFLMDTLIQMKVYGENAGDVIDKSFARLSEIENEMSKTIKESDIYKINESEGEFVSIEKETFRVIEKALHYTKLTDGKFDPSIGPLVSLWGIGTKDARVPTGKEIEEAKSLVNYKWVKLDPSNSSVKLQKKGMGLDLGAIAKGYAADDVRNILQSEGVKSAYINLGGNVLVIGGKPDGSFWNVGIQDPRQNRGNVMASIEVKNKTIVTSGNYERYFKKDGIIYHHIIDPTTGFPAKSGIISVSIISNDSFDADALSTSVFILGVEEGLELINDIEGVEALIIKKDLGIIMTDGLKDRVKILNDDFYMFGK